jgi:hypothetical protein
MTTPPPSPPSVATPMTDGSRALQPAPFGGRAGDAIAAFALRVITSAGATPAERRILGVRRGYCLMLVRLIVEGALGWSDGDLYRRFGVARTTRGAATRTDWSWFAADMEASAKRLGWPVPVADRRAGDLVFSHELAAPVGHVAVLLTPSLMLEAADPARRPRAFSRGDLCITPFGAWEPTLVARTGDS